MGNKRFNVGAGLASIGAIAVIIIIIHAVVVRGQQHPSPDQLRYPDCASGYALCVDTDEVAGSYALHDGKGEPQPVTVVSSYTVDGVVWYQVVMATGSPSVAPRKDMARWEFPDCGDQLPVCVTGDDTPDGGWAWWLYTLGDGAPERVELVSSRLDEATGVMWHTVRVP